MQTRAERFRFLPTLTVLHKITIGRKRWPRRGSCAASCRTVIVECGGRLLHCRCQARGPIAHRA